MKNQFRFEPAVCCLLFCCALSLGAGRAAAADRVAGHAAVTINFGSETWFDTMLQKSENQSMVYDLGGANHAQVIPEGCVEVAATINFVDGNPFPEHKIPMLSIVCRDQGADAVVRKVQPDEVGRFYTVLKRGQIYDFTWLKADGKEKFCSMQVRTDALNRQMLGVPYRSPEAHHEVEVGKPVFLMPRETSTLLTEYDLSGFPAHMVTPEGKKLAQTISSARTTSERANAHEQLAKYYHDKWDTKRAKAEEAKAKKLRDSLKNPDAVP